jgi:hypothetical protein
MRNLRSLTLDIGEFSPRQESFFYGLLQNIEIQAEYIRIYASDRIIRRVLEKSPQLQALHLPASTDITQFEPVVRGLRRLCTGVDHVKGGGPIQFPAINEVNLNEIAERYQGLEELALEECTWNTTNDNEAVVSAFVSAKSPSCLNLRRRQADHPLNKLGRRLRQGDQNLQKNARSEAPFHHY